MEKYDSKKDTLLHIEKVATLLKIISYELVCRGLNHDKSKLKNPEKKVLDAYTPKLKTTTYGSIEYKKYLEKMQKGLEHHYEHNSHHPEYYKNGINDFDLIDLVEMLCDWKAATERHKDGDIFKSIEINKNRFQISSQLCEILKNTATRFFKS